MFGKIERRKWSELRENTYTNFEKVENFTLMCYNNLLKPIKFPALMCTYEQNKNIVYKKYKIIITVV